GRTPRARSTAVFTIPIGSEPRGQQPGGLIHVDGLHEHAFLTVGQVRLAAAMRADEAGRGLLEAERPRGVLSPRPVPDARGSARPRPGPDLDRASSGTRRSPA